VDDFDDVRTSKAMMPSTLAVAAPAMTDRACSGAIAITAKDSDGNPAGVAEPTVVTLGVSGVSGSFYSDPGCGTTVTSIPVPVGTTGASAYFKPSSAGPATFTAVNADYLSAPGSTAVASVATRLAIEA